MIDRKIPFINEILAAVFVPVFFLTRVSADQHVSAEEYWRVNFCEVMKNFANLVAESHQRGKKIGFNSREYMTEESWKHRIKYDRYSIDARPLSEAEMLEVVNKVYSFERGNGIIEQRQLITRTLDEVWQDCMGRD